ncbi:MAG: NADH-quinone oxidoreductase subunit N [Bacteroidetes bacterium]|nr:NADH-quinone oxidoreductase subunit N [Bacteroidota bacterium]
MRSLLLIFLGAIAILFAGLGKKEIRMLPWAIALLLGALVFIPMDWIANEQPDWVNHIVPYFMMVFDRSALAFMAVIIIAAMLVLGLFGQREITGSDQLGLILFSLCGALILCSFTHMVMLFLGIEALSIPLFVLAGSRKKDLRSNEAAIKYFLMGAFSTAIFLMGCAFVYGGTGTLDLSVMQRVIPGSAAMGGMTGLAKTGVVLLMTGLCFKIAAVPFHFWSPDVYEGSPNRTTLFMATVVKIASFSAFFRLFNFAFSSPLAHGNWSFVLAILAAATILVGNIGALAQRNLKRTMAYSSIAHAGYMLLAILANPLESFWALIVYSLAYAGSSAVVFYILNKVQEKKGNTEFESFNGFGRANRWLGILLILALFSMAGIPVTAGFAGKFLLFSAAFTGFKWLVIVALLGSAISIAYYFRVFRHAFLTEADGDIIKPEWQDSVFLAIAATVLLLIGIWPALITGLQLFELH